MDVTLFEVHLDGAQFGPTTIDGESEDVAATAEPVDGGADGGSSRRTLRFVPVVAAVAVAVGYAASQRFRGGSDGDGDGNALDADAEAVEIEA